MSAEITTVMEKCVNKSITVKLKNGMIIRGNLQTFDPHLNLTLENAEDIADKEVKSLGKIILRGDNVLAVSLPD